MGIVELERLASYEEDLTPFWYIYVFLQRV